MRKLIFAAAISLISSAPAFAAPYSTTDVLGAISLCYRTDASTRTPAQAALCQTLFDAEPGCNNDPSCIAEHMRRRETAPGGTVIFRG